MSYHRPEDSTSGQPGRVGEETMHGSGVMRADKLEGRRTEERPRNKPCFPRKHIPQRVKVSWKYLPTNKNLKLKRTSYITLSIYHINQFSKNTFQVQTYYLCYNIYKYSRIIQFIARTLFGYYKVCKGIYLYIKKRGYRRQPEEQELLWVTKVPG